MDICKLYFFVMYNNCVASCSSLVVCAKIAWSFVNMTEFKIHFHNLKFFF
jgi:hypothetical protein